MVYFTDVRKTEHYIENHEKQIPIFEVISVIRNNSKNIKKKDEKLEIENKDYYILFEIKDNNT